MQLQIDIGFDQLVNIAKKLPTNQWTKLKAEVEKKKVSPSTDLESFLLSAPTFNKKQLDEIEKSRQSIVEWRKK